MTTVNEVIAYAQRFAREGLLGEDATHELVVQAFFQFHGLRDKSTPPGPIVGFASKKIKQRLKWCGPRTPHEAFDQLLMLQGAGMQNVSEKRPSPFRVIAALDTLRALKKRLTAQELHLVELVQDGATKDHLIACEMGIRETKVRALRKSIFLRFKELTK